MGFEDFLFWPFSLAFAGVGVIIAILFVIFWIWMIIDCAKRKFKNDLEKIIWILVIVSQLGLERSSTLLLLECTILAVLQKDKLTRVFEKPPKYDLFIC